MQFVCPKSLGARYLELWGHVCIIEYLKSGVISFIDSEKNDDEGV